ncbi:MAG: PQQ-binding-like beta-propeller repeat protein, partial [Planctomycetales bacterium]|nr:PQQ-binding-like beta-propeller repeat protein [Planctomycetales bacterium]
GGRDGAGLVAVGLKDGKTIWKATDEHASYSSPTRARIGGGERAVFFTRLSAMLIDPANGHVDAQIPFGQRGPTVNAATPLVAGDALFLTASYSIGARMLRVSPDGFEEIWSSDDVLSSQYNTPVYADGRLYGIHGREDVGVAALRCVEAATGKVRWSVDDFGVAHVLLAGDKLLLAKIDGQLVLAQASPEKFQPLARHAAFDGTLRAIPALSGGKLLARDDNELKCIDVSAGP